MTTIPPRVRPGDTIGIVTPAGPVQRARLAQGLACLGDVFALRVADSVTAPRAPTTPSYLAAPDEVRARELNAMLADRDVRAIVCARGGYGIMRILPLLDADLLRRDPKPIVGFSDATALLAWAYHAGVRGIHGPVIAQLGDLPADDTAHLVRLLTDPTPLGARAWSLRGAPDPAATVEIRAPLIAGNLSLVSFLVGTPWPLPLRDALVLLEEVGERPYEIDRYLTQLVLTGALDGARGAVIGDLVRCRDANPPAGTPDADDAALATVIERLHAARLPIAIGAPIGHGSRNEAIPFAARATLAFERERAVISIDDAAVA
ncbi:MAG TPA: LD-carboxypeptidase [Kofleriaceae bacterium]|nr:LD-carboxypeptidase [Kofleriaceae bacterium]